MDSDNDQGLEKIIHFNIKKNVTVLFKDILKVLEELKADNDESLFRLMESLPEEHKGKVVLAEFMTDSRCNRLRKNILDRGNDCIRNIQEQLDQVRIIPK